MSVYTVAQLNYRSEDFNEDAFGVFYDEYYNRVYNFIYFRIKDNFMAEELTGIIMEKILKNMGRYDEKRTALSTWVFTIARNTLIDFYRLKNRRDVYFEEGAELDLPDCITPGVEENLLFKEKSGVIEELLSCLQDREREILTLKFWGGLKSREIAEQLDMDEGNVNVVVFRALKKLKMHIEVNNIEF